MVFGGKYRTNFLPEAHQEKLFAFLATALKNQDCHPLKQGGHKDHLHLLFSAPPRLALSKVVQEIKKSTYNFLTNNKSQFPNFIGWQTGFGGFSYRKSDRPQLIKYIENQKTHHQKESFKEEYTRLLTEHNIPFDEKYLFT